MATACFESFKGGTELLNDIRCVCCKQKQLTHLVQLACFHLACKDCLQRKLQEPIRGNQFSCPECGKKWMVPSNGLDNFPDEPLQHRLEQITRIHSNEKPNCKLCEENNATSNSSRTCIKCKINLCENHAKYHVTKPGHTVITRAEIGEETNLILMMKTNANMCQEHNQEKNRFCKKRQIQICPSCPTYEAYDNPVVKVASEYRKILERKKEEVNKVKMRAKENESRLDKKIVGINKDYQMRGEKLQKERIRETKLEEKRQKLNREANHNIGEVEDQIAEEKSTSKQCDSAENYLRIFLQFSSDSDVLDKFQTFLKKLENYGIGLKEKEEKKGELSWKLEATSEDEEITQWSGVALGEDDIFVVFGTTLKRLSMVLDQEKSYQLSDLKHAGDVEVCGDELVISDREQRAVFLYDINKGFTKESNKLVLPQKEKAACDELGKGKAACGELGLAVDKNTKDIYVSSRATNTVYKYERTSRKFITWIKEELDEPCSLSVAPDHHLVVSNYRSKEVIKFNSKGKAVCRYGSNRSGERLLSYPLGVCTDLWDHVYIVDSEHKRIVVVSESGELLSNIDSLNKTKLRLFKKQIKAPLEISFKRDRLVVTAFHGQIYVFKIMFT